MTRDLHPAHHCAVLIVNDEDVQSVPVMLRHFVRTIKASLSTPGGNRVATANRGLTALSGVCVLGRGHYLGVAGLAPSRWSEGSGKTGSRLT